MAEKLSFQDVCQQYSQSVVLKKGEPVYILDVKEDSGNTYVRVKNLRSAKSLWEEFNQDNFKSPTCRLGLINVQDNVVFACRNPVRKMKIGLCQENLTFKLLDAAYPLGSVLAIRQARESNLPFFECMLNIYPSFSEALAKVKMPNEAGLRIVAFDRQFAISSDMKIYYKTMEVGTFPKNCKKIENIAFYKNHSHLNVLIGQNCEEDLRNSWSTPR